jgi:hypothetical protein
MVCNRMKEKDEEKQAPKIGELLSMIAQGLVERGKMDQATFNEFGTHGYDAGSAGWKGIVAWQRKSLY